MLVKTIVSKQCFFFKEILSLLQWFGFYDSVLLRASTLGTEVYGTLMDADVVCWMIIDCRLEFYVLPLYQFDT